MSQPKVLIPGGDGRLAQALKPLFVAAGADVWAPSKASLDLTAPDFETAVVAYGPTLVILAAAITSVDACERQPEKARAVNVTGVQRLIDSCGCWGIYVSTDYVFGAQGCAPFMEASEVAPCQVYGHTKVDAEASALKAGWAVARVAWLWGDGRGFPQWVTKKAKADGFVNVAAQRGTPTVIHDLAEGLMQLADERLGGVHHLVGSESCTRETWARGVLDRLGLSDVGVSSEPLEKVFAGIAPRPFDSSLSVTRTDTPRLRGWSAALETLPIDAVAAQEG